MDSNQLKTKLEQVERVRRDFVANVSHELRTPLTVVVGYLETLIERSVIEQPDWQPILQQMLQHSRRMENLTEDLLLLSTLEAKDPDEDKKPVPMVDLIQRAVFSAKEISHDQHQFRLQLDHDLLLHGNERELKSLVINLIINAVKYTPPGGTIDIFWGRRGKRTVFAVTDTGIGIAAKHIPRLTERFYRVDKARSRESGGTGLGLAIVKHVLLGHDGVLEIDSELGKGSTFRCVFDFV